MSSNNDILERKAEKLEKFPYRRSALEKTRVFDRAQRIRQIELSGCFSVSEGHCKAGRRWASKSRIADCGGLPKIRYLSARKESQIEIEVALSDFPARDAKWKYALGVKQRGRGSREPYVYYEKVWQEGTLILDRPDKEDRKDKIRLRQTHLEQTNSNIQFRDVADFASSVNYFHLVPQLLRHPDLLSGPVREEDPFGRGFLENIVQTPEKTRRSRLKKIEKALRIAVPQLKELTDSRDILGGPHLEAIFEHWPSKAGKQREDQFSDGTLRLIALLWSILESEAPLLLEEPELSLHTSIVKQLPGLIWRLQRGKKRQIVISTHSRELLDDPGIGGEEVLLLKPSPEGTDLQPASSDKEIRILLEAGLSIADVAISKIEPTSREKDASKRLWFRARKAQLKWAPITTEYCRLLFWNNGMRRKRPCTLRALKEL